MDLMTPETVPLGEGFAIRSNFEAQKRVADT